MKGGSGDMKKQQGIFGFCQGFGIYNKWVKSDDRDSLSLLPRASILQGNVY